MTAKQYFADPLRSNRMLSSSEEAVIRSSYWATDSSISQLEFQMRDLLLRRNALCNHRQMLATLLSPIRRLPPELLSEIFHNCLPQNYDGEAAHKAVMLPSHVCQHWRDVALSTPTLWTNIVLRVTDKNFESRVALVTTWFSRSGGSPLSFTLKGYENVQPIIAFLLQHCNRWQCINLSVPFNTLRCLETAKGHLQRLEILQIDTHTRGDPASPYSAEHIFESAPRLWKVSLDCRFMWNGPSGSWAQLAELDAGGASCTTGDCLALLQSMQNLRKLRIYVGSGVVEGHRCFVHPLVSLHLLGKHHILDHITLPSLCNLSVDEIDFGWPHFQFISFLERSAPPLRSFSFEVPMEIDSIWHDNIIQILQHMSSLHSLCLMCNCCEVGDICSFMRRLSPRTLENGRVDSLIPKLNAVSIWLGSQFIHTDYDALKEMVISRHSLPRNTNAGDNVSHPVERIKEVEVKCSFEDYEEDFGTTWHEEVSEILAPLQGVVDTLRVVIS